MNKTLREEEKLYYLPMPSTPHMSSVILYITVAERSAKPGHKEVRIIDGKRKTDGHDRLLTSFIIIINRDGCWFGFLHNGRLVNFEREPNFVNLRNKYIRKLFNIAICNEARIHSPMHKT